MRYSALDHNVHRMLKKRLFLVLFLLASAAVQAQFSAPIDLSESTAGAIDVVSFDVDNDGDEDVICASDFDGKVSLYKNQGAGNFDRQEIIIELDRQLKSIDAADLNADGDLDLIVGWYPDGGLNGMVVWH